MEDFLMIYNAQVDIIVNVEDGRFIGEMSFLSNHRASASVKTSRPTEFIRWKQKNLKDLMGRNPSLLFSLQAAMGSQISDALSEKNKN